MTHKLNDAYAMLQQAAHDRHVILTSFLSLFAAAQKVTKKAAAADKRLKINSHITQENKLSRLRIL